MKIKYRLFKRGKFFYAEDAQTRRQCSLHTKDPLEAQRLIAAKNEAVNNAQFTLAIGKTYLAVTDAEILTRTWKEVMDVVTLRGGGSTQARSKRAFKSSAFDKIRGKIAQMNSTARAAEFNRRCSILEIKGVSLHSYRYAWAERAYRAGYPERFAQAALGHGSRAIHHAYARRAKVKCPTLEDYEKKIVPLPTVKAETPPIQQAV